MLQSQHKQAAEDFLVEAKELYETGVNPRLAEWLIKVAGVHATLAVIPDEPDYRLWVG